MKFSRSYRRTTVLIWGCTALLAGLGAAQIGVVLPLWFTITMGIGAIVSLTKRHNLALLLLVIAGFGLGAWRGASFITRLEPYQEYVGQRVSVQVRAESDAVYNDRGQLEFDAGNVQFIEPAVVKAPGRMRISGFGQPAVFRGDTVEASGRLYRTRGSRQAGISFAQMTVTGQNDSRFEAMRRRFVAGMHSALPEPHSSLALGILIGQRTTLPDDVNEQLSIVGLTHIIAVSGYNLTIIVSGVRRGLRRLSKYQIFMLSTLLVLSFLFVTGFSASIVRAAIVSGLSLLAWYYGRIMRPLLILLLSAVITAGWYPLYLWSDIGWWLSFLAFFGVLILAPLLVQRYGRGREPKLLSGVMLESFCAQLMVVPLILFIFSEASTISLLANILVVPLIPLAMLASLVAGVGGMALPLAAGWLALPARLLLGYMLDMVQLLSRVPYAKIAHTIDVQHMIALYILLALVSWTLWRKVMKPATVTEIKA